MLADHLARAVQDDVQDENGKNGAMPVLPWILPDAALAEWPADFDAPHDELKPLLARVIQGSIHLQSPRFIGHQVSAPLPISAGVSEMVAALLNNGMAVYEMGPVSTAMERSLALWMAKKIGFGPDGDAIFTSGRLWPET